MPRKPAKDAKYPGIFDILRKNSRKSGQPATLSIDSITFEADNYSYYVTVPISRKITKDRDDSFCFDATSKECLVFSVHSYARFYACEESPEWLRGERWNYNDFQKSFLKKLQDKVDEAVKKHQSAWEKKRQESIEKYEQWCAENPEKAKEIEEHSVAKKSVANTSAVIKFAADLHSIRDQVEVALKKISNNTFDDEACSFFQGAMYVGLRGSSAFRHKVIKKNRKKDE